MALLQGLEQLKRDPFHLNVRKERTCVDTIVQIGDEVLSDEECGATFCSDGIHRVGNHVGAAFDRVCLCQQLLELVKSCVKRLVCVVFAIDLDNNDAFFTFALDRFEKLAVYQEIAEDRIHRTSFLFFYDPQPGAEYAESFGVCFPNCWQKQPTILHMSCLKTVEECPCMWMKALDCPALSLVSGLKPQELLRGQIKYEDMLNDVSGRGGLGLSWQYASRQATRAKAVVNIKVYVFPALKHASQLAASF
ncbi:hypothetical protein AC1031_006657 [Aphanomyces cochlioides]|nr:hypothetical protein AC1031_006657 [Aphanomyces cochlioides]